MLIVIGLVLVSPLSVLLALAIGSVDIPLNDLWQVISGNDNGMNATLVLQLRLPRALAAFAIGGLLALSGTLLQALLRNPLADPYILGISGGASLAALLTILFGLGTVWLHINAFIGSVLSMFLVFGLSRFHDSWSQPRLLLTGVVIAAGWGALISFILSVSPNTSLHGMLFWLMGEIQYDTKPLISFGILFVGIVLTYPLARHLNLLLRGEKVARSLGINAQGLQLAIYFIASLLTAAAVTQAGSIGFVGLVIPHILRLIGGSDHRYLIPASVLLGGSLLVLADTLARTVFAPTQLPTGVLTAMIGVPIFLVLLTRRAHL